MTLGQYLGSRLEFLRTCNAAIHNHIEEEKRRLLDFEAKDDEGERAIVLGLHRLDCMVGQTFRYSMLIAYCTFCEEALRVISQAIAPSYEADLQNHQRGNWLQKHCRLLDAHGIDLSQRQTQVTDLLDAVPIRNCIVHAWGDLTQARHRKHIEEIVKRSKHFAISCDQFLLLNDTATPAIGIAARELCEFVLREAGGFDMPIPARKSLQA